MHWVRLSITFILFTIFFVTVLNAENNGTKTRRFRTRRPATLRVRDSVPKKASEDDSEVTAEAKPEIKRRKQNTRNRVKVEEPESAGSIPSRVTARLKPNRLSALTSSFGSNSKSSSGKGGHGKIVCYYTNWSQYRPKIGKFIPEDIPSDLCTHVIFAFGWMKKGKLSSFETNDDTKDGKVGLYDRINNLKKANPDLKTLLAIGGWSFGTQKFKEMAATRYSRQIFVFSAIPFLRERNFDGLDLDWEYPKGSDDKKNYALLVRELNEAFEAEAEETKRPKLLLTAAVPVGPDSIRGGYDVPQVAKYLDFINLMAYDFHGKWESQTGHNAPLYAPSSDSEWRKQLSVDHAAGIWVKLGAPKEKLVIGMPTYGRSFTLQDKNNFTVNVATKGGGNAGVYTREAGFLAYYEICEMLRSGSAKYFWDEEMKVPYLVQDDQWVGFDDERAIRNKMKWIKEQGFGGAMVWSIDMDDFTGTTCGNNVKYPLIGIMKEELLGVKREGNPNDIDWEEIAGGTHIVSIPSAQKISLSDVLAKANNKKVKVPLVSLPAVIDDSKSRPAQVLCYVTSWSAKRDGAGRFNIDEIDSTLCTHVVFGFAKLKENKLAPSDPSLDIGDDYKKGNYQKLQGLKEKNPNLKIMLSLGGPKYGSKPFRDLTTNIFRMNNFVYDAVEFLREHSFDGLDIDWSYPENSDDRQSHLDLIRELRLAFEGEAKSSKNSRLILTAAVSAQEDQVETGYDVIELSKFVDFFNVKSFDFNGDWDKQVGHNSPLQALESATTNQKKKTVDAALKIWLKYGAPKEKLIVGMPTYGRTFTLSDPDKFDIGAPAIGGGSKGKYTSEEGFLSYYEICDFLQQENTTLVWDNEQSVPFAYKGSKWCGFDDERSFKSKGEWLKEEGYAGVFIWSIDLDDFKNTCGAGKYPLIKSIASELEGYRVGLEYNGPHEGTLSNGSGGKKDPNVITCDEEDGHISYHRDTSDCTKYFMCEGDRKHHMPCPQKLVFNINENVCDWPANVPECESHVETK